MSCLLKYAQMHKSAGCVLGGNRGKRGTRSVRLLISVERENGKFQKSGKGGNAANRVGTKKIGNSLRPDSLQF